MKTRISRLVGGFSATFAAYICLAALASGCALGWNDCIVRVEAPALPAAWSEALDPPYRWEVRWAWLGGSGGPVSLGAGETLAIALPRTGSAAVECRAVMGGTLSLPYGALWPMDARGDGSLALSPGGGYVAVLAAALYRSGFDAAGFDMDRFALEAQVRMEDPWDRDPSGFAAEIVAGGFRADSLNQPERFVATVAGLSRALMPDSPWGSVIQPDALGSAVVSMAPGVRRWMGGGYRLTVSMDTGGSFCLALDGPD